MEKQKKSIGAIALVILLLILAIVSLILATYAWAKYTSTRTGSATAEVAAWNVTFSDNSNNTLTHSYSHVVEGKIAPGTDGSFDVTVNPGSSEVCFNYTIKIDSVQFIDPNGNVLADTTTLSNNGTPEDTSDDVTLGQLRSHIRFTYNNTDLTDGTNVISGSYGLSGTNHNSTTNAGFSDSSNGVYTISWAWPYELTGDGVTAEQKAAYNKIDTAAGEYSNANAVTANNVTTNGLRLKVNYTATAVQVQPGNQNH